MLDPLRAPVVERIFAWRVEARLSYEHIAARLNTDPDRYPPPVPKLRSRVLGEWTGSSVRDVLTNPKYTG